MWHIATFFVKKCLLPYLPPTRYFSRHSFNGVLPIVLFRQANASRGWNLLDLLVHFNQSQIVDQYFFDLCTQIVKVFCTLKNAKGNGTNLLDVSFLKPWCVVTSSMFSLTDRSMELSLQRSTVLTVTYGAENVWSAVATIFYTSKKKKLYWNCLKN